VAKSYARYCPVSHALDLVGERWSLLVATELLYGPLRYSDLLTRLSCGTNILAARLKDLESAGIVSRRRLPPPAASNVYELTEYGLGLRPVLHELGHWGARSLGPPPTDAVLHTGWLPCALECALATAATEDSFEFHVGDEIASIAGGVVRSGSLADPDVVIEADPQGFYHLLVDRDLDAVELSGDREALERLLDRLPTAPTPPVAV
jgi:DNA-binding HxlR family transcriptional regulator